MKHLMQVDVVKNRLYVLGIIAAVVIPVSLTMLRVKETLHIELSTTNPTPLGYTTSLLIFVFPLTILALWFLSHSKFTFQKKAFLIALAILVPLGVVLDLLFAHSFFLFENKGAVLGWYIPGVGGDIPVEEFIFYISGFAFVLLLYIWGDEFWLERYNVPDYHSRVDERYLIFQFHPLSLIVALVLIIAAIAYKKLYSDIPDGLPYYWIYLTLVGLTPAMGLMKSVAPFINWRSLGFTLVIVVLVSLIWEVTLALPYHWWSFQHRHMIGLYVKAWFGLPIEEVILWISVSYASITIYETVKIYLAKKRAK